MSENLREGIFLTHTVKYTEIKHYYATGQKRKGALTTATNNYIIEIHDRHIADQVPRSSDAVLPAVEKFCLTKQLPGSHRVRHRYNDILSEATRAFATLTGLYGAAIQCEIRIQCR